MVTENFKILTDREHVRLRTGVFLGSVSLEQIDRFLLGQWQTVEYVPALLKMVDEIIDNAIDEAIRTNFKSANMISVTVKNNSVTVEDNGRGIPHDLITDTETKKKILRPVAAWTRVRSGTSFSNDRISIGANGIGSAATNFMSRKFVGETWHGGDMIRVRATDGANKFNVDQIPAKSKRTSGTKVTFQPDFSLLGVKSLSEGDHIKLIEDRIMSLQIAFPKIRFKFNGVFAQNNTLKKYAGLFHKTSLTVQRKNLAYFVCPSDDGYRTTGYVNGVHTRYGGTYNSYVVNNICEHLIKMIKRKYKVDVNKSIIKNGLTFVCFANNFQNPQFDSQTKERLTNTPAQVRKHFEASKGLPFEQFARKIMACDEIIEPIVEAQVAKKLAAERRAATLAQKKAKKNKVAKHIPATTTDATLFICEGDSAISFAINVRDPKMVGIYPLQGVPKNSWDETPMQVMKNQRLAELVTILQLDINKPDSIDNMPYKNITTLADADHDGNHITGLLMAFFYRFWPRLFTENRIHMTRTPIMISTRGKSVKWFYSYQDAQDFKAKHPLWDHRYIKGLATLTEEEYDSIINRPVYSTITVDDAAWFEVIFGNSSIPRKDWLQDKQPELIT